MVNLMLYNILFVSNDSIIVLQLSLEYFGINVLAAVAGENLAVVVHWFF